MFAVIFEVNPKPERWDDYLRYAGLLKPELEKIDGFLDNERFASKRREGWLVSLSIWRDEKALIRWRTLGLHHEVQEKGRNQVFRDYHLRVGEIVADTQHGALPGQRFDETEVGIAKLATVSEARIGGAASAVEWDLFESITRPGHFLSLNFWRDAQAAKAWVDASPGTRHRTVRIIRDYGMFARTEAPQYYPPVSSK
ncbi:MAG: antibiotic biosynthesis monooxygenase [Acidisphaera sp.]|nr:antibiotic biosynthesis monooxygenase [Acidisphaera sp.]